MAGIGGGQDRGVHHVRQLVAVGQQQARLPHQVEHAAGDVLFTHAGAGNAGEA